MYQNEIKLVQHEISELENSLQEEEGLTGDFDITAVFDFKKVVSGMGNTKLDIEFLKTFERKQIKQIVSRFIEKIVVQDLEDGSTKVDIKYKVNKDDLQLILKINKQKGLLEIADNSFFTLKSDKEEHTFFLNNKSGCKGHYSPPVSKKHI